LEREYTRLRQSPLGIKQKEVLRIRTVVQSEIMDRAHGKMTDEEAAKTNEYIREVLSGKIEV